MPKPMKAASAVKPPKMSGTKMAGMAKLEAMQEAKAPPKSGMKKTKKGY